MKLYAITAVREHTCNNFRGDNTGRHEEDKCTAGRTDALEGRFRGRCIPAQQLADAVRQKYEQHGRTWSSKEVYAELLLHDQTAHRSMGNSVYRVLKREYELSDSLEIEMAQGFAACLRDRGWGVAFHTADYKAVREQALDIIRKKFDAIVRHGKAKARQKLAKITEETVDSQLASIHQYWHDESGNQTEEEVTYWCGWTLVPPEMMGDGLNNFPPVSTIDAAGFRSRARGVLLVRACTNGNNNVQTVSASHMLATESNLSCGAHTNAESLLIRGTTGECPLNSKTRVTCMDGGAQLRTAEKNAFPSTNILRCSRHLHDDVQRGGASAKRDTLEPFKKLANLPVGRRDAARALLQKIPQLSKVREEELCPALLPSGVCTHGVKVCPLPVHY